MMHESTFTVGRVWHPMSLPAQYRTSVWKTTYSIACMCKITSVCFHSLMPYRCMHNTEMCNPTNTCTTKRVHKGMGHHSHSREEAWNVHQGHDAPQHAWLHGTSYVCMHALMHTYACPMMNISLRHKHHAQCTMGIVHNRVSSRIRCRFRQHLMLIDGLESADCATTISGC